MSKSTKPPKVIWVCVSDNGDDHSGFNRRRDVCCGTIFGGTGRCCAYEKGCRPVKYGRLG